MAKELWQLLRLYLLAMNLAAFAVMGFDKNRAKSGKWRISERALFLPVLLGGAPGGTAGLEMLTFRLYNIMHGITENTDNFSSPPL